MNSYLLNRSQGSISPSAFHVAHNAHLIRSIEPAPGIRFSSHPTTPELNRGERESTEDGWKDEEKDESRAHKAGVNVLTIDQYEKRFMVSGGADASVHLWDLETRGSESSYLYKSIASVTKSISPAAHTHALTSISIYPFDPTPSTILTTSHDTTLKLSSLQAPAIIPVYTFSLHSTPYSHSFSSHPSSLLLAAVGTSDKAVRLLDLRSGLATHALPGHSSAILSVSWAPHHEYLLASASHDNRVILFDVRRGGHNSALASLDMDDAVGVVAPHDAPPSFACRNPYAPDVRAHNGAVTGVRWTSSGSHIVTSGHDARIRVWDASTGANSLVHFGPRVCNSASLHLPERAPLVLPNDVAGAGHATLLWPNCGDQDDTGEVFVFALRDGAFIKRLRVPGVPGSRQRMRGRPTALSAAPINGLAWRGNGASGEGMELFSAHGDGTIRAWVSRTSDEAHGIAENEEMEERKRKRDVLDAVYRGLMNRKVTFT
ncbi:WD40 repeat-containing protein [Histoplasma capsulatum var. duboisii H88]|uniref:WD domain-containing protein n=2 Tax=Ajellomyces capsulatus TaxID=5037 RepID=F0UD55_AJEC8|nr:WD40 domain-containing protein [Histoplasma capsulatum H143]EGC42650.1 WD40 repeat-containing protein [Histoplasma capsulatum var. duboisii H88]QSS48841.1 WD domain-containing protein [Histoplasma capsulatum var. duboisii H88]